MANEIFWAIDPSRGPDRTAEVAYRLLPDGRIQIVDMQTYTETINLPRKIDGSFGDKEQ